MPNLILIAGTGRNSGKTILACSIIHQFSAQLNITAIKISPHRHESSSVENIIAIGSDFVITQETDQKRPKDSSRMLKAGATSSYYIETIDTNLEQAFIKLLEIIPPDQPIICESPGLRAFVEPGIFIIADNPSISAKKTNVVNRIDSADFIFDITKDKPEDLLSQIQFSNNHWQFSH
jgi:hypothetical protein